MPAILAAGANAPLPPRRVIEAYLVGFEVIARLGEGLNFDHYDRGWHSTATLGVIGAAAAIARLLDFKREQTVNALALAASPATGAKDILGQAGDLASRIESGRLSWDSLKQHV